MALSSLCAIISPPAVPNETGTPEGWRHVEERIGLALPSDYEAYIDAFGTGEIASFFTPFNPFAANKYLNLLEMIDSFLEGLRADEFCPWPVYPTRGGVLPWGTTWNGHSLCWITDGHPDQWTMAVAMVRDMDYEQCAENMTEFLPKLLTGKIESETLPREAWASDVVFEP